MITNNAGLYAFVQSLSSDLQKAGDQESAQALASALTISSVASEVLGEIRLQLRHLQEKPVIAHLNLQSRVDEALTYLNKKLRTLFF